MSQDSFRVKNSLVIAAVAAQPSSPENGQIIYNSTANAFEKYVNGAWVADAVLPTLTANRALASDGTGTITVSATTDTELAYLSGVTSAIQTQLNAKMTNPMTTIGDMIYGAAAGAPTRIPNGGNGDILQANGSSAPTWVTPASNATASSIAARNSQAGLTARTFAPQINTTATAGGTTTLTNASFGTQVFTGTTVQTLVMPVNNTLSTQGTQYQIKNRSTGVVTVNSSGGNLIKAMAPNSSMQLTLKTTTLDTTAAAWDVSYSLDEVTLITNTSAIKAVTASNVFSQMTSNSITIPIGTWELFASVDGGNNGTGPGYAEVGLGIFGTNGADNATVPTLLSATPNLTIISHNIVLGVLGVQYYVGSSALFNPMASVGPIIVTVTAATTVFAVPYMGMTIPANARLTVGITARRLY
jgi:hypothetical protein